MNDQTLPRKITEQDPPQFPCWLWHVSSKSWKHWSDEGIWTESGMPGIYYTHWLPDQPTAPEVVLETAHGTTPMAITNSLAEKCQSLGITFEEGIRRLADDAFQPAPRDTAEVTRRLASSLVDMVDMSETLIKNIAEFSKDPRILSMSNPRLIEAKDALKVYRVARAQQEGK